MSNSRTHVLSTLVALAACSESPAPDASPDACGAYAQVLCERKEACGPGWFQVEYGTRDGCEQVEATACASRRDAIASGLTAAVLDACRATLVDATCTTVLDPDLVRCTARGAHADHDACLYSDQCAGGDCYFELNSNLCGSCRSLGAKGDASSPDPDAAASCAPGLACFPDGTCREAPISLAGETCDPASMRRCASTLFCNAAFVCVPQLAEGEPCRELLNECDVTQRLFCDPALDRCRPIPLHGAGEYCPPIGVPDGGVCGHGLYIDGDLMCQPVLGEGAACDPRSPGCGPGLACTADRTCVALSDLTCAGGTIDPGDDGGGGDDFLFDISFATLELDCEAETATLSYNARYWNPLETTKEAIVEGADVMLGNLALSFKIIPATSGPVAPNTAVGVVHRGTRLVPGGACDMCNLPQADLTAAIAVDGLVKTFTRPAAVACTLDGPTAAKDPRSAGTNPLTR